MIGYTYLPFLEMLGDFEFRAEHHGRCHIRFAKEHEAHGPVVVLLRLAMRSAVQHKSRPEFQTISSHFTFTSRSLHVHFRSSVVIQMFVQSELIQSLPKCTKWIRCIRAILHLPCHATKHKKHIMKNPSKHFAHFAHFTPLAHFAHFAHWSKSKKTS